MQPAHTLTVTDIDSLIQQLHDNESMGCPLYAEVASSLRPLTDYPAHWGAFFWPEFSGFTLDYLHYRRFMLAQAIREPVVDLGCSHGFASSLFLDVGYHGVDRELGACIHGDHPAVSYQQADARDIQLTDRIVISNMSLGFFDKGPLKIHPDTLAQFRQAKIVMIAAPMALIETLLPEFDEHDWLPHSEGAVCTTSQAIQRPKKNPAMPRFTTGRVILSRR